MTVIALINMLSRYPNNIEVLMYDSDAGEVMPVTGCVYDEVNKTVQLYSDEP